VLSCVGDSAGVETLFLARFITFKIATTEHPKQKPRREGASNRYTPATKSLYRSIFKKS
jgi:hypothetical protein